MEFYDRFIPPKGFRFSGVSAGIKTRNKDLGLIFSEIPAKSASVYTTNKMAAAPIKVSIEHQKAMMPQAVIINSGNANSATGKQGLEDAWKMAEITGKKLGIDKKSVLVASTGIIGEPLPMDKIEPAINAAVHSLGVNKGYEVAEAILTTDTKTKEASVQFEIDGQLITMSGIAKGSGMIAPKMQHPQATMLAFLVTDLRVSSKVIRKALNEVTDRTFNSITVDGDTSTNDMAVLMANGTANNHKIMLGDKNEKLVVEAIELVCASLAKKIVLDGEGATKLINIKVIGAKSSYDAKKASKAIANSLLVKTAFFGQDANWGRVLNAVGYSGAEIDPRKINLTFGDITLIKNGLPAKVNKEKFAEYMLQFELEVTVDLQLGKEKSSVLTCDLSYDYVKINAEYHT